MIGPLADFVVTLDGQGYIIVPALPPSSADDFDISFTVKPTGANGVLWATVEELDDDTARVQDVTPEFAAVGLRDGLVVFRYNVGSGVAEIVSMQPVVMGAWNTIHIKRTDNEGTLVVNDVDVAKGISPGSETRLKLGKEVLLGGLAEYAHADVDFKSGFVGDIAIYSINGTAVDVGAQRIASSRVTLANTCAAGQAAKCVNDGRCLLAHTYHGYRCLCPANFAGTHCERRTTVCANRACHIA